MKKYIFDTDIGDDIDDAFALSLLCSLAGKEIAGVTTVFRNTKKRAQLAKTLLAAAGFENVPVYAGESFPYKEPFHLFGKDAENAKPEESAPCQWTEEYAAAKYEDDAVNFIAESAKKYGKDLVLFAVGPLTNLARAIEKEEAVKHIGAIYTMGGYFSKDQAEWNILCDPEAAQIVYSSGIPVYACGLDVTLRCTLEADLLQAFRDSKKATNRLLIYWLDRWKEFFGFEKSVMHDPLAVASAFADICRFEKRYVKTSDTNRGAVEAHESQNGGTSPVYVAEDVNPSAFYRLIREKLL